MKDVVRGGYRNLIKAVANFLILFLLFSRFFEHSPLLIFCVAPHKYSCNPIHF